MVTDERPADAGEIAAEQGNMPAVGETSSNNDSPDQASTARSPRTRSSGRGSRRREPGQKPARPPAARSKKNSAPVTLEKVLATFVACGRCSFFLAGYRALHGLDNLQQAVDQSNGKWLDLTWDFQTRHLLQSSYGGKLDVDLYYYGGCCKECQRRFEFMEAADEDTPGSLRVELRLA
ncbi:MAG: hypothetical protein H6666_02060 [Ardenticatenaceae bacterium]|nr:hypothetical protein [Anaerolineales bacterium]MCB8916683.1 hypothetical protein [Ardenticatenaceae bacterium]